MSVAQFGRFLSLFLVGIWLVRADPLLAGTYTKGH